MFWVNDPSTVSPITADNLARSERFLAATAGANGDFYVTIPNGANVTTNDIIHLRLPAATDNTKDARISVNGGTTYKNIITNANVPAYAVENQRLSFVYDSFTTRWIPLDPVGGVSGSWRWVHHPDGRAEAWGASVSVSYTFTADFVTGALYRLNGTAAIPSGIFNATPTGVFTDYPGTTTTFASIIGYATSTTAIAMQAIRNNNGNITVAANLYVVGTWK